MLIPKIIGYAKMNTAKRINQSRNTRVNPVWHRNYYEHVIRNENELNDVRQYIVDNPAKWDTDEENPNAKPPQPR
jgi:REP element-mobilizing transposase RayT